ncbi:cellulose synthase/poly-beta-1,6-N-acetylglucosamine synthase-like glycosyltransferase [Anaerobacterium chartisolvens]|uniref:Cellulose synthase/poly-beta-1,6-N-acetylglucosamine synthase-like glycosyltransferase n=1 Tax=Anaerobacterium chartisolvens TaxID=1297424 RepID=A0A369ANY2_9FIRM|nr:glycosyltransferase family 2 protein [Anaerobacterium chartisolvens]RCX09976.1 cellulose synthase/poly-beta-1,6-N-acetylglucosamine synthase-like glycosyltransferase [Anaerobacterium chartisolvens]
MLNIVGMVFQYALLSVFLYYFIISVFGWFKRKEASASMFPPKNKFAVIVAAHNEEIVIGSIVKNLKQLNYPRDMYDILVIADNCSDKTAKVARQNGASVYERFDSVKKGKGYSLEWMFKKLFAADKIYDAICIFDADNLASPNFLLEMNKQLCMGNKVIQGYLDSKNPSDSWISGNYSISYWTSNRLFQLPRHYLGLSCALGGTGFVMAWDVLKEIGWGATCLTEDLEFSMKLVLKNMRVSWSHEAVVYDEKPLHLPQSWRQRRRWMQGHCNCAQRFLKKLILKAFRDRDKVAFDAGMYLLQPFIIVANAVNMIITGVSFLTGEKSIVLNTRTVLLALLLLILTYYSIIFVFAEGKLTKRILRYFITFPIYSLTWVPIIIHGFIDRNKNEWVHTVHTRALDITDVKSLERVS